MGDSSFDVMVFIKQSLQNDLILVLSVYNIILAIIYFSAVNSLPNACTYDDIPNKTELNCSH